MPLNCFSPLVHWLTVLSPPSAWNMVGQQYTSKQRTFMAIEYYKKVGTRGFMDEIIADFVARYPAAIPPSRTTIWRQAKHLDRFSTLHNLNSKVICHDFFHSFICIEFTFSRYDSAQQFDYSPLSPAPVTHIVEGPGQQPPLQMQLLCGLFVQEMRKKSLISRTLQSAQLEGMCWA